MDVRIFVPRGNSVYGRSIAAPQLAQAKKLTRFVFSFLVFGKLAPLNHRAI
ncbi:MAG TPA: hypothetical protein VGJ06_10195 [Candidatus Acidoferrum sp.]